MADDHTRQLELARDRAQHTLKHAIEAACSADVTDADTGELIRVEEVLAIATEAAKETISVRRRLRREREKIHAPAAESTRSHGGLFGHREIEDELGVRWAVFEVHPSASNGRPTVRERYRDGWLSFDSGLETRRIAPVPQGWAKLSDAELVDMITRAEAVPRRARSIIPGKPADTSAAPHSGG